MSKHDYEVIVANIGTVYQGQNGFIALQTYGQYKKSSKLPFGRASGETITLMRDGHIWREYESALTQE